MSSPSPIVQEALARAIVDKKDIVAVPTPDQQRAQAQAKDIRAKLTTTDPRAALEALAQRRPMEQGRVKNLNEQNIGVTRRPDGSKRRAGDEITRFNDANNYTETAQTFFDKGYDGLNPTQQEDLREIMENTLRAWPEASILLDEMAAGLGGNREKALIEMLKDPIYATKLRMFFEHATNPSKAIADVVTEAQRRVEEARHKVDTKEQEVRANGTEIINNTTELASFNPGGAKAIELATVTANMPTLIADKSRLEREIQSRRNQIVTNERLLNVAERAGNAPEITRLSTAIGTLETEISTRERDLIAKNNDINRKSELEAEKSKLDTQKTELADKKSQLTEELRSLRQERAQLNGELNEAKAQRLSMESEYVEGLKNIYTEAAMAMIQEKIDAAETIQAELLEKEKTDAKDPVEQAILKDLTTRWDRTIDKGNGKKEFKYNKDYIDVDYATLISSGPKELMKVMAKRQSITLTASAIEDQFKNKEFLEQMQTKVVERLITRRVQTGKITESEARLIIESDWGKGMIDKAIVNKKELKDTMDKLKEQGLMKEGWGAWLKNNSKGNILLFLLLALGSFVTVSALPRTMNLAGSLRR